MPDDGQSEDQTGIAVIGAGVIGLAIARALARTGREVVLLEAEAAIGTQVSARSSEVIHAGLHGEPGWRKVRHCIAGRRLLYAYAAERNVEARKLGKLVVAIEEGELPALLGLQERAEANGVEGLELLTSAEASRLAPGLRCAGALLSAETGIIDSHGLMSALRGDAIEAGAALALLSPVLGGAPAADGLALEVGGESPMRLSCGAVVNAAGLSAQRVARSIEGFPSALAPRQHLAKGNYFALSGRSPFPLLVYPMPEPGGLGVHLTLDLGGQARFGPDVEWLDGVDYNVTEARLPRFEAAVRRYWPALPRGAMRPAYAGVRPKISGPEEVARDFLVQGPSDHGVPGLWNLFGIESPGLTAALALAEEMAALVTSG